MIQLGAMVAAILVISAVDATAITLGLAEGVMIGQTRLGRGALVYRDQRACGVSPRLALEKGWIWVMDFGEGL